mmetsp:Transcript_110763/g.220288  ORF Transcript_110763/g.220288 Transcript_110763/m.220288 type:complete len:221 (-) Transcript_110763:122-784(-)|eukprot:CAMPEP_0172821294 /NCGR_PEP_ID=MMETSP1075-20121228/15848_1 /TAXON_ID=2916 /ORGANISM="Ceratium fusus, Strain PA161109" /LENGTH=220 /DNA_ID=CAMNT_0013662101 /DNA_START=39 /DNA_END=701 /DNA_ORIENTATION=-
MARTKAEARQAIKEQVKGIKGNKKVKTSMSSSLNPPGSKEPRLPSGVGALREIRRYQSSTNLLFRKISFQRIVREICMKLGGGFRFEVQALLGLQEAAETFLVGLFEDAGLCALHGRRVTVMQRDLRLSTRLRGGEAPGSRAASAHFQGRASRSATTASELQQKTSATATATALAPSGPPAATTPRTAAWMAAPVTPTVCAPRTPAAAAVPGTPCGGATT